RIGDTGEPCGIPFSTAFISPRIPSMHTAPCRSSRKDTTHFTYWSGIPLRLNSVSSWWLTKSKYPFMS
ncbi:hypothetical protein DFH07DRAFT_691218, partial [Mycena maculata]